MAGSSVLALMRSQSQAESLLLSVLTLLVLV